MDQSGDSEVLEGLGSQLSSLRHSALKAIELVFLELDVDAGAHRVDIQFFIDKNECTSLFVISSNLYRYNFLASILKVIVYFSNYWFKRVLF